jgi:hypothetical protein
MEKYRRVAQKMRDGRLSEITDSEATLLSDELVFALAKNSKRWKRILIKRQIAFTSYLAFLSKDEELYLAAL